MINSLVRPHEASQSGSDAQNERGSQLHILKCWPHFFNAISAGQKRHDLRRAIDRDFKVGDQLLMREFIPDSETYTGRHLRALITYITSADIPCALSSEALDPNFCILSIALLPQD